MHSRDMREPGVLAGIDGGGVFRAGLTSMPIMPWHGAPRFWGPPWAARIF